MASELRPVDLKNAPSLRDLVDEVRKTNQARIIRADGEDVAVLMPAPTRKQSPKRLHKRAFSRDDALWDVVGIGRSGVSDVSSNKDAYLAEAYLSESESREV
jgi:hypothetical protein